MRQIKDLKEREIQFKNKFEKIFPNFEYAGGYKNCDSSFKCKCRTCGNIQERNANCIRKPNRKMKCDNCTKVNKHTKKRKIYIYTDKQREKRNMIRRLKRKEKLKNPIKCSKCGRLFIRNHGLQKLCDSCNKDAIKKQYMQKLKKPVYCKECGILFLRKRGNQLYCSEKCKRKAEYRIKEINRRYKLKENGRIDWNITLDKLIKRDKGLCKICGQAIDINDYYYDDKGNFIAGNDYPSIDHIRPVSKGGTHTWGNVQLAHRRCNSNKNDNNTYESVNGQIKLAI